jgi:guanine deaminase
MDLSSLTGWRGLVLDAPAFGELRAWPDGAVIADKATGKIVATGDYPALAAQYPAAAWADAEADTRLICPGLVDVHAHLPQYPASGCGDGELLPWLRAHIFPLERAFDPERCRKQAPLFFHDLARNGTTAAMLYTVLSEASCDAAFQAAEASGLRLTLGKVMMDIGSYGDTAADRIVAASLSESERLCRRWNGANGGLLRYAFSPRFALSCSEELMRGAGDLARQFDVPIQTHLSENLAEVESVRQLFPRALDYTDVYDQCGLLTPRTVLGHCVHLSAREMETLAARGSKAAHCPTANFFLNSGLMPLARMRDAGVGIGLGSDVGAGPELNLWQVMRSALETQKARSYYEPGTPLLSPAEAFFLATMGGAETLGLGGTIGTLAPGKDADLLVLDKTALAPYGKLRELEPAEWLSLAIYRGGPHATVASYVRARAVYERPS